MEALDSQNRNMHCGNSQNRKNCGNSQDRNMYIFSSQISVETWFPRHYTPVVDYLLNITVT